MIDLAKSPLLPATAAMALAGVLMIGAPRPAQACYVEGYIGSVCFTASSFCPRGYASAQGQLLSIREYTALYAVIGTTYGGDGRNTFALPDLRGRTVVSSGKGTGLSQNLVLGQPRGEESTTLGLSELPVHNHTITTPSTVAMSGAVTVATGNGTQSTVTPGQTVYPAGLEIVDGDGNITYSGPYTATAPTSPAIMPVSVTGNINIGQVTTVKNGGNQAFSNLSPQMALSACVMAEGIYPPRP